jgi:voltage-gated potassium channel
MRSRLLRAALYLAAVFAVGTAGYRLIEGAGWWDAFYMSVMTLTTVGSDAVFPLSRAGQAFTVVLLLTGLGILLLVATEIGRGVLEGELRNLLGQARRSRMLESLERHEIVCGWGRMGRTVVEELRRAHHVVVVIESNPEKVAQLQEIGVPVVHGDATKEAALRSAGIERARGLVACLADDAHNVYTVLTARSLNPGLFIVARAGEEGSESRILRAGANRVVSPYKHGGVRLAQVLMKPAVVDFLDLSLGRSGEGGLDLQQLVLPETAPLAGHTLAEGDLRRRWGVGVVAVQRGEELFPNPDAALRLAAGDVLVVLGTRKALDAFAAGAASATEV